MTTTSSERIVRAPPIEVFDFMARNHFANHPKWDPDLLEMTQTTPGDIGVGTTARVVRRQGQGRIEGIATVTAFEPDRAAAWDIRFGPFLLRQRSDYALEDGGRATRVRITIETSARGPMRLALPLMRGRFRRTLDRSLETIAALIEGRENARPPAQAEGADSVDV